MGTGGIGRLETCSECKGTGKDPLYVAPTPDAWLFTNDEGEPVATCRWDISKHVLSEVRPLYLGPPELAELPTRIAGYQEEIDALTSRCGELEGVKNIIRKDRDVLKLEVDRLTEENELNRNEREVVCTNYELLKAENERLKEVTNFSEAVACVFDNLKFAAANTGSKEWDDQLEDLAEDVIEYSPEYKKQWKDIGKLSADLRSANADKEAYAQNAIDLRNRLTLSEQKIAEMILLLRMAYLDENVTEERCARLVQLIS